MLQLIQYEELFETNPRYFLQALWFFIRNLDATQGGFLHVKETGFFVLFSSVSILNISDIKTRLHKRHLPGLFPPCRLSLATVFGDYFTLIQLCW